MKKLILIISTIWVVGCQESAPVCDPEMQVCDVAVVEPPVEDVVDLVGAETLNWNNGSWNQNTWK